MRRACAGVRAPPGLLRSRQVEPSVPSTTRRVVDNVLERGGEWWRLHSTAPASGVHSITFGVFVDTSSSRLVVNKPGRQPFGRGVSRAPVQGDRPDATGAPGRALSVGADVRPGRVAPTRDASGTAGRKRQQLHGPPARADQETGAER